MKSFVDIASTLAGQPLPLGVRLGRVDIGRGREELHADQLPELLRSLAESTRVASITASSAIEGVVVGDQRARQILGAAAGTSRGFRSRNERELAGYRDAIDEIMRAREPEPISVPLICHLHRQLFAHLPGGGGRLKSDDNVVVSYGGGRRTVLFTPTPWEETPFQLRELCQRYEDAVAAEVAHPLFLIGLFVLDLLAIHPFADGNGSVARMATTHLLLRAGYSVPRYVSVEQRVFETKNAYYAALRDSQRGWHEARHSPWPWIEYLIGVLADAYDVFEQLVVTARSDGPITTKQGRVRQYVLEFGPDDFAIADLRRALPGIGDQTFRIVLGALRDEGRVQVDGTGRSARWARIP